jgi:hypothetical protein
MPHPKPAANRDTRSHADAVALNNRNTRKSTQWP